MFGCPVAQPDFWSESDLNWGIELRLVRYNNHMVGCNFDTGRTIRHCHGALRTRWKYSFSFGDCREKSQRLGRHRKRIFE